MSKKNPDAMYIRQMGYNDGHSTGYAKGYQTGFDEGVEHSRINYELELAPEPAPAKWLEVSVDPKGAGHTYKLRVPGGWLYRTVTYRWPEYHAIMEDYFVNYSGNWAEAKQAIVDDFVWTIKDFRNACEIATQTTVFVPEAA